jgi:hypothetical protein
VDVSIDSNLNIAFQPEYRRNYKFTGREDILSQLDAHFRPGSISEGQPEARSALLYGSGGIGKTQVALEYAHTHSGEFTSIFWVNASTLQTCQKSFADIAQRLLNHYAIHFSTEVPNHLLAATRLGLSGLVDENGNLIAQESQFGRVSIAVKSWLCRSGNDKWLVIFENVVGMESFDISAFLPHSSHGNLIMTSRRHETRHLVSALRLELREMTEEESVKLLLGAALREPNSEGNLNLGLSRTWES